MKCGLVDARTTGPDLRRTARGACLILVRVPPVRSGMHGKSPLIAAAPACERTVAGSSHKADRCGFRADRHWPGGASPPAAAPFPARLWQTGLVHADDACPVPAARPS